MAWSLDWFAAEALGKSGAQIRRVSWTTQWLTWQLGLVYLNTSAGSRLVQAADFGEAEFNARDYTDQPFSADPCAAVAAYNTAPVTYLQWTPAPIFVPPPPPGFPDT